MPSHAQQTERSMDGSTVASPAQTIGQNRASAAQPKSLMKRVLRPLIPRRLLSERAVCQKLGPAAPAYIKLRLAQTAGLSASNHRRVAPGARSFLFVCYGNIMRSPMAEHMLRRALAENGIEGVRVSSAGIHAIQGSEAHPRAQVAARELGLPLDHHRSRLLTSALIDDADAVFAMDLQNKAELLTLFPNSRQKIFMLGTYAAGHRGCEIPDPFFGDQETARTCYRQLQNCIDNLLASLWPDRKPATQTVGGSAGAAEKI